MIKKIILYVRFFRNERAYSVESNFTMLGISSNSMREGLIVGIS